MLLFIWAIAFPGILQAEIIDQVVAVVNGRVITQHQVEKERQFQALESSGDDAPSSSSVVNDRQLVDRLIDQELLKQQMAQYEEIVVPPEEIARQIAQIQAGTGGPEALQTQLQGSQLSRGDLELRIKWQLQILKFVDSRFRQFLTVEPKEIEEYYKSIYLPELAERKLPPPPQPEVEEKIRDLLMEEKVNQQLEAWLKSIRSTTPIQFLSKSSLVTLEPPKDAKFR